MAPPIFFIKRDTAMWRLYKSIKKVDTLTSVDLQFYVLLVLFVNHKFMNSCLIFDSCANKVNAIRKS